jgi:hypothetical protein
MESSLTNCQSTVQDHSSASAGFPCRQVRTLSKISRTELEAQLMEAQAKLQLATPSGDVSSTVTLVRLGSFEVRLINKLNVSPVSPVRFWLELFDHDRRLSIDSVGDCLIEDAVVAAGEFIARAIKSSENPHTWRRRS